jgi:hypothetical protein
MKVVCAALALGALSLSGMARAEYVITVTANGIEVTNNWNGASVPVAGSPFVENPIVHLAEEVENPPAVLSPTAIALDPAGAYLYSYYNTDGGESYFFSFAVESNGALKQLSSVMETIGPCAYCQSGIKVMTASVHFVAVFVPQEGGEVFLMSTKAGVLKFERIYSTDHYITGSAAVVTSIQIDPSEHWRYVNYSSTGATVPDTAAVFNMQSLPSSLVYLARLPEGNGGVQIVP